MVILSVMYYFVLVNNLFSWCQVIGQFGYM